MLHKRFLLMSFLVFFGNLHARSSFNFGFSFGNSHGSPAVDFNFGRPRAKTYIVPSVSSVIYCEPSSTEFQSEHCCCHGCSERSDQADEFRKMRKKQRKQLELADLRTREKRIQRKISELKGEIECLEDELEATENKIVKLKNVRVV